MPEILQPYKEINALGERGKLGKAMFALIARSDVQTTLRRRGHRSTIANNRKSATESQYNMYGQVHSLNVKAFAIVAGNQYVGEAVRYRRRQLWRAPPIGAVIPAVLSRNAGLNHEVKGLDSYIFAWTMPEHDDLLPVVYKKLVDLEVDRFAKIEMDQPKIWTIEPVRSAQTIHDAIIAAGLRQLGTDRYDIGESGMRPTSRAHFYVLT